MASFEKFCAPFFLFLLTLQWAGRSAEAREISCPTPSAFAKLPAPSSTEKSWISSRLYYAVESQYGHWADPAGKTAFERDFRRFLDQADQARTRLQFDRSVWRLFSTLHDGHTRFYDALTLCQPHLPLRARYRDGAWVVLGSALADVPPGAVITTIDGQDFAAWAETTLSFIADSSVRGQRHLLFSTMALPLWPVTFTLGFKDGTRRPIDRDRIEPHAWRGLYESPDRVTADRVTATLVRIAIPSFEDPKYEADALAALKKYRHSPAVLLDLRGNNGGTTPLALARAVVEQPFRAMVFATPMHIATNDAYAAREKFAFSFPHPVMQYGGDVIQPDHPFYHGKLYALADEDCASACEEFLMILRSAHRGIILGERSWGIAGMSRATDLTGLNMSFTIGTERAFDPDGRLFDGQGIDPDRPVSVTPAELGKGRDVILEKTIHLISQ